MTALGSESVLKPRDDIRFRRVADEGIVVSQSSSEVLVLSDVAIEILSRLDGKTSLDAVVDQLLDAYEVERTKLEGDVLRFAGELVEGGLAVEVMERP